LRPGPLVKWFSGGVWKFAEVVYGERGWELHWSKAEPDQELLVRPVILELQQFWPLCVIGGLEEALLEVVGNVFYNPQILGEDETE
jgi:hypothetical protein